MNSDAYRSLPIFNFARELSKRHQKKPLKCLIYGNFGAKNYGDEAILAGVLKELSSIPHINPTVVSKNPELVKKIHKVNSINQYNLPKLVDEIRKSDFVVIGGGGIICKSDRGVLGVLFQLYMLFAYLFLPLFFRKNVYALGMGIYDNANKVVLNLGCLLLKSADILTVRDFTSYDLFQKKQIPCLIYKDNSFLMNLLSIEDVLKDGYMQKTLNKSRKNIGFALLKPDNKVDQHELVIQLLKIAKEMYKEYDFWLYPCDFQENYDNDLEFANEMKRRMDEELDEKVNCNVVPTSLSPQVFFSSFKLMDYFVTTRLHGAIFSYRNKIDFTGLSYDKKTSSFLSSIGKSSVTIRDMSLHVFNNI